MRTIVWDVDDVLNDLMSGWFHASWLPANPSSQLRYRDLSANPPHRILGLSETAYFDSLDRFRESEPASRLTPNAEILAWLARCGSTFRHIALTARPVHTTPKLAEWLFRHFGGYIRLFGVVPTRPTPGEPVYDRTKAEFLSWLGRGDIFIDDSSENVEAASRLGFQAILFPQPWNASRLTPAEALLEIDQPELARSGA